MSFNNLRTKILLNFLIMLLVVVAVTLYTVQSATYKHSTGTLLSHTQTSATVVEDKLSNQVSRLTSALNTMSTTFNFIRLVATANEDKESLQVALSNFQSRAGADLTWVQNTNGELLGITRDANGIALPNNGEMFRSEGLTWWQIADEYYLVKSTPMAFTPRSQNIQAWIFMGVNVSNIITSDLLTLTDDEHITLALLGSENELISTTLEDNIITPMLAQPVATQPGLHQFEDAMSEWLYATFTLGTLGNRPVNLILSTVKSKAYLSYNSLLVQLVGILAIAAVMAILAAMLISRGITRPVTKLVDVANKIRQGEYVESFPRSTTNEVSSLTNAINSMQDGIVEREKEIQHLAFYDSLTDLPNRNQFQKHLQQTISEHGDSMIAVLMMDVDRFKEINDTIGHDAGDQLLKEIAKRLKASARKDMFIAHIGGDEFAVISKIEVEKEAEKIAETFSGMFDRAFMMEQLTLDVDISIGVSVYPTHADSAQGLMQCADIALYTNKDRHFSYFIYQESLNKHSVQRLSLMSELRGALEEEQLQLFYQPKMDIAKNKITAVEALIRWIHPEHGFIPPDEFIPLAEQTGAIRDVTHWALKTAMKQCQQWTDLGFNLDIAVNISAIDLIDMKLPAYVAELMSEYTCAVNKLTLEVTESTVMTDPSSALKALNTLQFMGVRLSIDDFGTGYSSMAQLKKMPVKELKIDKAFVLDLATNEDDKIMTRTLVSLAQNLGLETVAEGVEDADTLKYLEQVGCTKAQGFYLSRPLPADKFNEWFAEHESEAFMAVNQN